MFQYSLQFYRLMISLGQFCDSFKFLIFFPVVRYVCGRQAFIWTAVVLTYSLFGTFRPIYHFLFTSKNQIPLCGICFLSLLVNLISSTITWCWKLRLIALETIVVFFNYMEIKIRFTFIYLNIFSLMLIIGCFCEETCSKFLKLLCTLYMIYLINRTIFALRKIFIKQF